MSSCGYSEVPAISQLHLQNHFCKGQTQSCTALGSYLRHVCYVHSFLINGGGTVISAVLPMSPRGSDCLIVCD